MRDPQLEQGATHTFVSDPHSETMNLVLHLQGRIEALERSLGISGAPEPTETAHAVDTDISPVISNEESAGGEAPAPPNSGTMLLADEIAALRDKLSRQIHEVYVERLEAKVSPNRIHELVELQVRYNNLRSSDNPAADEIDFNAVTAELDSGRLYSNATASYATKLQDAVRAKTTLDELQEIDVRNAPWPKWA